MATTVSWASFSIFSFSVRLPARRKRGHIALSVRRIKFVIQNRKAINRRRLDAQNQIAERNGLRAGVLDRFQFVRREIAFRADPDAGAFRRTAVAFQIREKIRADAGVPFATSRRVADQTFPFAPGNFRWIAGASISGSQAAPHCLMASMATCCHFSRLCSASSSSRCVTTRSVSSGTIRPRAKLDGFLDDALDDFSLGNGHEQRDGAGRRRDKIRFFTRNDSSSRAAFSTVQEFIARAVQHDRFVPRFKRSTCSACAPRVRRAADVSAQSFGGR